jgi:hypothetical protein
MRHALAMLPVYRRAKVRVKLIHKSRFDTSVVEQGAFGSAAVNRASFAAAEAGAAETVDGLFAHLGAGAIASGGARSKPEKAAALAPARHHRLPVEIRAHQAVVPDRPPAVEAARFFTVFSYDDTSHADWIRMISEAGLSGIQNGLNSLLSDCNGFRPRDRRNDEAKTFVSL